MFHWIEARAFCHATEEEERVATALRTVVSETAPRREVLEGHFGNPVVVLTARVDTAPEVRTVWARVLAALGKDVVLQGLDDRLDENVVYHLRLDKQRAYMGNIEAATTPDVIALRAKVAAFPSKRETALQTLRLAAEEA